MARWPSKWRTKIRDHFDFPFSLAAEDFFGFFDVFSVSFPDSIRWALRAGTIAEQCEQSSINFLARHYGTPQLRKYESCPLS